MEVYLWKFREDKITELFTMVETGSWIRIDRMQRESIDAGQKHMILLMENYTNEGK